MECCPTHELILEAEAPDGSTYYYSTYLPTTNTHNTSSYPLYALYYLRPERSSVQGSKE
jgi:hypothetical protein